MANRIVRLDALSLSDHYHLDGQDECYYVGEYTARAGHAHSATNQLILNFKKSVETRGTPQWKYKDLAIQQAADIFREAIHPGAVLTFVPVPPSKAKTDPLYDDRMLRLLQAVCAGRHTDIRELVLQRQSVMAAHLAEHRPTPDELVQNYVIDESLSHPAPAMIIVVDDVLTTGCHFKAMKRVLHERFPGANIVGLFIARRVPNTIDPAQIFGEDWQDLI